MSFNDAAGSGDWAVCIKVLDAELKAPTMATPPTEGQAPLRLALLLNRGYCLQKLMINRKALKASGGRSGARSNHSKILVATKSCPTLGQDYDEALSLSPSSVEALHRKGQVLVALKKPQARLAWGCGQAWGTHGVTQPCRVRRAGGQPACGAGGLLLPASSCILPGDSVHAHP